VIKNSYSKFKEKFDRRKVGSVFNDTSLKALGVTIIDLNAILLLLK